MVTRSRCATSEAQTCGEPHCGEPTSPAATSLRNADFRWADLTDAEFGYVMTHDPNYGLTDVTGANWQGACLKRVKMDRVIGWFKD